MRKRVFLQKPLLLLNLVLSLLLLLSYFAEKVSPDDSWIFSFIGLFYPFFLILNLLFIIYWIVFGRYYYLISVIVILAGFGFIGRYFQLSGKSLDEDAKNAFKVLSFNVHNLTQNNYAELRKRQNDLFDYVIDESPDIVCLQEFYSQGENYYYPLINLKEKLKAENYYFQSYYNPYRSKIVGMVIFSKFQRINRGILASDSTRKFGVFADFVHKGDTFRVYNLHLESIYLQQDDYDILTGNFSDNQNESIRTQTSRIGGKLKTAFQKRASQVDLVRTEIDKCPWPVIICGDFNDTPNSYAYHKLTENLQDAFVESGLGIGKTFNSRIPFLRIDYILHDEVFKSYDYDSKFLEISDHYPVSCFLSMEN